MLTTYLAFVRRRPRRLSSCLAAGLGGDDAAAIDRLGG